MAVSKKRTVLKIIAIALLLIVAVITGYAIWFSHHYKQIIMKQLPQAVEKATDSVYHISFSDINISIFNRSITITDVKLWPDEEQVKALRRDHRRTPPTLSTVSIAKLEATGIDWRGILSKKLIDCNQITVHDLKWKMVCKPHPEDSLFAHDKRSSPKIEGIMAAHVSIKNPDVTYEYVGTKASFACYMKGGTATLNDWAYYSNQAKDTSTFLYAHSGKVRFDNFIFSKPTGRYSIKKPLIDFETTDKTVTLKHVEIKHMTDNDPQTGKEKEYYNLSFPAIELAGLNWNRLIDDGELVIPKVNATAPMIDIHFIRANEDKNGRAGDFPNQLLLQVGLKTDLREVNIKTGHFKYTEVTPKGDEGIIEFTGIHGSFGNVTNIKEIIAHDKSCMVKLHGKFMNKSDVQANFDLLLTDKTGRFKVDGYIENMDGDDVSQQAQVFTIVKVTSFHLSHMDMHIEGDQTYAKGDFTVLYENLKISLFKFDSKYREGKHGPFAFVGSALLLYPSNPMPNKDVRKVSTTFARDSTKGFISLLWQNIYRGVKKTAVREKDIITLTDGPETSKGEKPKKGIFKRVFGKKN